MNKSTIVVGKVKNYNMIPGGFVILFDTPFEPGIIAKLEGKLLKVTFEEISEEI